MDGIEYVGEHLWYGRMGHLSLLVGFCASLLAALAYFFSKSATETEQKQLYFAARTAVVVQALSVFLVFGLLLTVMINRYYEYDYVWGHVSDHLPFAYIFSAFWEGQEGSFLLWMFWHAVLSLVLLARRKPWENGVLMTLSLIQLTLFFMLLGVYWGEQRIGINPFVLFREAKAGIPLLASPNYLDLIDGQGLNPLLQNYWNVIHPPITFLGFASMSIPFCFAIDAFWKEDFQTWISSSLVWGLFGVGILGVGILMGCAWAYEALTFGGYWAWDPVENGILVPWLLAVAGLHTNVVAKSTGQSIKSTFIFYSLAFWFTVYATFLTRSGVLGETSVHAFTQMGLEWQLIIMLAIFLILATVTYFSKAKKVPTPEKEEHIASREFWMFMGSLVLLFSAGLITFTTSIPVFNKIYDAIGQFTGLNLETLKRDAPIEPIAHYNKYQIWIAILIAFFSGVAQWLRYKESRWTSQGPVFLKRITVHLIVAIVLGFLLNIWIGAKGWQYVILLFALVYAVVANADFLLSVKKNRLKLWSSALSHIGFGIMLLGSLVSGINKKYLTSDTFVLSTLFDSSFKDKYNKNLYLTQGRSRQMNDYKITYLGDSIIDHNRYINISYQKIDTTTGEVTQQFVLSPHMTYNKEFTEMKAINPAIRRRSGYDIFTHITHAPQEILSVEAAEAFEDSLDYKKYDLYEGDTIVINERISIVGFDVSVHPADHPDYEAELGDIVLSADIDLYYKILDTIITAKPMIVVNKGVYVYKFPAIVNDLNIRIRLDQNSVNEFLPFSETINTKSYKLSEGEIFQYDGHEIEFMGFDRSPQHPNYYAENGDIAIAAVFKIDDQQVAKPIYFIRGNQPMVVKDYALKKRLTFLFNGVDPQTGEVSLDVSQISGGTPKLSFNLASGVARNDFVVLEAIIFKGMNLFWLGSIMMFLGVFLAMYKRWI